MQRVRNTGFALIDVLIALLLLAIAMLGACAALIQTQQATYGALLAMRAVDLVADLEEALQSVNSITQRQELLAAWRQRVSTELPMQGIREAEAVVWETTGDAEARTRLTLRWRAAGSGALRELRLPLSSSLAPAA